MQLYFVSSIPTLEFSSGKKKGTLTLEASVSEWGSLNKNKGESIPSQVSKQVVLFEMKVIDWLSLVVVDSGCPR